jgi:hypothetical protein
MGASRRLPGSWSAGAAAALFLLAGTPACHRSRLLPRADGAAVVVVTSPDSGGAEPGVTAVAETEPNGALATAQKIDLGATSALTISASIAPAGAEPAARGRDVDLYRLVVLSETDAASPGAAGGVAQGITPDAAGAAARPSNRRRLSALVHPDLGLPVSVEVLDDAGQSLVAAVGGQPGEVEGIPSLTVTPGIYFLKVRAAQAGAEGGYRLTVRLLPVEVGEEIEPNGKATLARDLSPTGEAVGYFGWRKDQDWYRVPLDGLAEGSVLSADLEAVPGVTASLLVFDSVERKLMEVRGRKEERVALRNIRLPAGEPALFLQVRADAGRNVDVRYNLRVRTEIAKPGGAGGDLEPNDDAAHANPLADGTVQGYLGRGDIDVYRYSAAEPLELDVEAAPPERVDLKMEIIREPDGLLLVRSDVGKRHEPERLANVFVAPGSVLIRLYAARDDGNADEPYRLTVSSRQPQPGAEREPNGTAAAAMPLVGGTAGNGLLFPRGDVDFWQSPVTADAEGNVAITASGIAGLAIDLRVITLANKEVGHFKINGDAPVTNRLTVGAEPCCLLQVKEATGKAANFRDRYTVTVGR